MTGVLEVAPQRLRTVRGGRGGVRRGAGGGEGGREEGGGGGGGGVRGRKWREVRRPKNIAQIVEAGNRGVPELKRPGECEQPPNELPLQKNREAGENKERQFFQEESREWNSARSRHETLERPGVEKQQQKWQRDEHGITQETKNEKEENEQVAQSGGRTSGAGVSAEGEDTIETAENFLALRDPGDGLHL